MRLGNDVDVAHPGGGPAGRGAGHRSLLGVFWGTGVGSGIILDDEPWVGRGAAGEFGHMVVKLSGAALHLRPIGCVEAYAGRKVDGVARAGAEEERPPAPDLFKIMKQRERDTLSSGVWARALEDGDTMARS